MKNKARVFVSLPLLLVCVCAALVLAADDKPAYEKKELFIPSADSIRLATDLYMPPGNGPFATILIRSPYNKDGAKGDAEKMVKEGFAVVVQDTRGRLKTNGRFYAFAPEREDGLATLKWIRSQSWSNGRVGGWGGSYVGYTQWAIADQLDASTPLVTTADMYDALQTSGIFSLATCFNWGLIMNNPKIKVEKILAAYRTLPLSVADDSTGLANAFVDDWLRHPAHDDYWQAMAFRKANKNPILSMAGWYDIFLEPQIQDFLALGKNRHKDSHLVIGPFAHGQITISTDFGDNAKLDRYMKLARAFLVHNLKNPQEPANYPDSLLNKTYALFIVHRNQYYLCDEWPPQKSKATKYFLSANGRMEPKEPAQKGQVQYRYDPQDPYPSLGGSFLGIGVGPAWQNPNVSRKDQAIFESDSLNSPLTLLGPVNASLDVSSDVATTEFYASLQDVLPNGQIVNIQEGGAIWKGKANKNRRLDISLWSAGYELAKGHKMRLVVSSSLFPRFNRTLNGGESPFIAKQIRTSQQTVYFGKGHDSYVTLPVLQP
jgi:uncharacterized protein